MVQRFVVQETQAQNAPYIKVYVKIVNLSKFIILVWFSDKFFHNL